MTAAAVATPLIDEAPDTSALSGANAAAQSAGQSAAPRETDPPAARGATRTVDAQRVVPATVVKRKPVKVLKRQAELQARAEAATRPVSFKIASFNVLGSQHTAPGGERRSFPSASWRTPQAAGLIAKHGADVVGTQELQADQLAGLQNQTGFAAYPGYALGNKRTDNSILYNPAKFEFVEGSTFWITFMGGQHPQTVLKLRERSTGREMWFINMHTSAGHDKKNTASRIAGHNTGIDVANQLQASGLPVFVTGDMNDRAEFFCRFLPRTGMVAAVGGSTAGGCHPPGHMAVDWITGSNDVAFSNYWEDGTPQARKISDHYFVSALATVAPATRR